MLCDAEVVWTWSDSFSVWVLFNFFCSSFIAVCEHMFIVLWKLGWYLALCKNSCHNFDLVDWRMLSDSGKYSLKIKSGKVAFRDGSVTDAKGTMCSKV